ncbi:MAG: hypothetical protein EOO29_47930 [Comamonadaceae bacterium]|nr:MAG: hypothetical protein EOO29_47930 [Comamonadaceae bacterium]
MPNRLVPPSLLLAMCLMATSISVSAMAQSQASGKEPLRSKAPATREQVRDAVNAHRAAEQEQIQRDEAMAGRRLTAAERSELREQLRQEWAQRATPVVAVQAVPPSTASNAQARNGWTWRSIFFWSRAPQP